MHFKQIVVLFGIRVFVGTCIQALESEHEYDVRVYADDFAKWMHKPARELRGIVEMKARQVARGEALIASGWRPNVGLTQQARTTLCADDTHPFTARI